MVASEVAPYSTVGGLSQVVYFLANSLIKLGHDVRIFSAKYGVIQPKKPFKRVLWHIKIPTGYQGKSYPQELICNVVTNQIGPLKVYFLENRASLKKIIFMSAPLKQKKKFLITNIL